MRLPGSSLYTDPHTPLRLLCVGPDLGGVSRRHLLASMGLSSLLPLDTSRTCLKHVLGLLIPRHRHRLPHFSCWHSSPSVPTVSTEI